ncbi:MULTISPECIES: DDE-type integrase/transposase/recombinase [Dethiosulfovibrio]|uniref:DDE-type integrase/transposase/recombinase n=1 Tax=Dethiosulfovibrio TaxID=47054 RepID=UPI0038B3EB8E
MTTWLCREGYNVNRKRVQRLMRIMGLEGLAPKPGTSRSRPEREVYPYLLRNVKVGKPNQVWSTDITYCRLTCGFMYIVAVIDWYSRYILSWELSNTL